MPTPTEGPLQPDPDRALTYQPRSVTHRPRLLRRIGLVVIFLLLAGAAYHWRAQISHQAQVQYAQHRVARFVAPNTRVVLETDAARSALLLSSDPHYRHCIGSSGPVMFMADEARDWERLRKECRETPGTSANLQNTPVIFLHELRHPKSGATRLLCVTGATFSTWSNGSATLPAVVRVGSGRAFSTWSNGSATLRSGPSLIAERLEPARPFRSPVFAGQEILIETQRRPDFSTHVMIAGEPQAPQDVIQRIYAGQADPSDPSHFTIDFDTPGGRRTFDGHLSEDGESVSIEILKR